MKIEHIAMYVQNLEQAKDFFIHYFGAASNSGYYNERTGFRSYFLTFDDSTRLEIMSRPDMQDSPKSVLRTGLIHFAISVGSRERVDTLTAQLKEDGYRILSGPRVTGDGYYESCIAGFEDNLIEITV